MLRLLAGAAVLALAMPMSAAALAMPGGAIPAAGEMDRFIDAQLEALEMPGVSVALIEDGEIVYARQTGQADYWSDRVIDEKSIFEMGSLSKPVFAYFTLKLADQGVIDMDRPLMEVRPIPELADSAAFATITPRHVLSHRTGLPNWRWFDPRPEGLDVPRGQLYLRQEPGTFGYSGEGFRYLAETIAATTGHDLFNLDALFQYQVAQPLGLQPMSFVATPEVSRHKVAGHKDGARNIKAWPQTFPDDQPQTFGAAGRLHANAPLYARFLIALMEGEGLSEDAHEAMFTSAVTIAEDDPGRLAGGEVGWTMGLSIKDGPGGRHFAHGGNNGDFQSGFAIWPATRSGYVFVTNSDKGEAFEAALQDLLFAD
ncbi:serine hydrolase domain-containing protein [Sphingomicrobium arenosum]|uniref:serine hydrolase domain-containing protein n=1 Tax=Sphingomicrobium arenosum TaxID=2233861 RepID=UPI002240A8EB|nr:serine hydrolase domain-containing protein [Sphingomicrobium arenosum]